MYRLYLIILVFTIVIGCTDKARTEHQVADIQEAYDKGNLTNATNWSHDLISMGNVDTLTINKVGLILDMCNRIESDFTLTEADVNKLLKREYISYTQAERDQWERNNWLEFMIIDGTKHYFKRAVSNLKLILQSRIRQVKPINNPDPQSVFCLNHSRMVIEKSRQNNQPVLPVKMKLSYKITVNADAVPEGEIIRCWLPWPHENTQRQEKITLMRTVPTENIIAPDTVLQRSIYLEKKSSKGKPTVFELQFEYVSMAQYFDLKKSNILPYDTSQTVYKKYTAEQYPQIRFTKEIKYLSDSIIQGVTEPAEKVKRIYYWINNHVIWTGALEYSIIPYIAGYVLKNRRGDCGMQTLLFMSMARYQHIPVKWQSGWMMHPNEVNLHDWCEVYYNGIGWVPLDMSFNLQKSNDVREREFYISGIDSYRLIINEGIGSPLVPHKIFPRSEPYDFQRGEVEWKKGNLYFNQWDYKMTVSYNQTSTNDKSIY